MKCKTPNEVLLADALVAILRDLPSYSCEDFHHDKKDRHEGYDNCPVEKRFHDAVETALLILSKS